MSERIDHTAEARRLQSGARSIVRAINGDPALQPHMAAVIMLDDARLEAQLALVEQQRIANIIAIASNVSEDPDVPVTAGERAAWLALCNERPPHSLRPEIREALGIRE